MRPLTLLERQRITLSLFFTVAVGAVFTVATPAFVPWQVVDNKRAQALDQQRRQGKDFHVIEDHRHRSRNQQGSSNNEDGSSSSHRDNSNISNGSKSPMDDGNKEDHPDKQSSVTPSAISSQGALVSLLTDRSKPTTTTPIDPSLTENEVSDADPSAATKKRRRRRKRKMVNEGWQEFTGRTAREEKEKQEQQQQQHQNHTPPVLGENGGIEISWKNKTNS